MPTKEAVEKLKKEQQKKKCAILIPPSESSDGEYIAVSVKKKIYDNMSHKPYYMVAPACTRN